MSFVCGDSVMNVKYKIPRNTRFNFGLRDCVILVDYGRVWNARFYFRLQDPIMNVNYKILWNTRFNFRLRDCVILVDYGRAWNARFYFRLQDPIMNVNYKILWSTRFICRLRDCVMTSRACFNIIKSHCPNVRCFLHQHLLMWEQN